MAKKKNESEESAPQQVADEGMVERNIPEENLPRRKGKNLRIKMDADGNILWDEMTDAQKQQFAATVANDVTALEMIGLSAGAGGEEGGILGEVIPEISEKNVGMCLDFLAWIQSMIFTKFMRFDEDIADKVCKFDEDQHKELDARGARIANKRAPEFVKKFQDEIFFVGMLAWYMSMQLQTAKQMQQDRNRDKKLSTLQQSKDVVEKAEGAAA